MVRVPVWKAPFFYIGQLDSDGPVTLELPEQWLWDIIDEFIYQYQSFSVWRSKAASKTEEELASLGDAGQVESPDDDYTIGC